MGLIAEAERILFEEAAKLADIAGAGPSRAAGAAADAGAAGGAALGGLVAGPAGAGIGAGVGRSLGSLGFDSLTGSGTDKKRKLRQRARVTAGRFAELLGKAIKAEMDRRGLGALFERVSGGAPVTRWSDTLPDIRQLRGVPRGEGQRAATLFMDAAAPPQRVSVPPKLYRSDAWAAMGQVWGDFSEVAGRFAAVMAALDSRSGLPDPRAGEAALKRAYAEQWGALERSGVRLGGLASGARQEGGTPFQQRAEAARRAQEARQNGATGTARPDSVPGWPSEGLPQGLRGINPRTGRRYIGRESWNEMSVAQRVDWLTRNGLPVEYADDARGEQRYRERTAKKTKKSGGVLGWALGLGGFALGGLALARRKPKRRR